MAKLSNAVAAFDFDKTLIKVDSFNDFLLFSFGFRRVAIAYFIYSWLIFLYSAGIVSNSTMKTALFKYFFKGMRTDKYKELCFQYFDKKQKFQTNLVAISRLKWHQDLGHNVIIISASPSGLINAWAENHCIDKVFSAKEEQRNGLLTGLFVEECPHKKRKAELLNEYINDNSIARSYAYGDSSGDRHMLRAADFPFFRSFGEKSKVIITDGQWRKSMSAVRALGKSWLHVSVFGDTIFTPSFFSRFTSKRILVSLNEDSAQKLIDIALRQSRDTISPSKPVILPMEEATLQLVSKYRDQLSGYFDFLIPPKQALEICLDKAKTMRHAEKLGIAIPKTFYPKCPEDAHNILVELGKFSTDDFILKPTKGSGSAGIVYCPNSSMDLKKHWNKFGPLLIQERIEREGVIVGTSLLFDESGKCRLIFSHKRTRQFPITGGPSTDRVSITNPELENKALRLLKSLKFVGVAMVEWKLDNKRNQFVLLEVNPRFWGSLELAERAGIDFPTSYFILAKRKPLYVENNYIVSKRCRWLIPGDVLRYISEKKSDRETLSEFLNGLPSEAEEWDVQDISGTLATIFASLCLVLTRPGYLKFLRNKRI